LDVDTDVLKLGINDMMTGDKTLLTELQMRETLTAFQKELMARQQKLREAQAITNRVAGESYLAANKAKPGVVTLADGLQYLVITNGTGATPVSGDIVKVQYTGTLVDGTVFDSSVGHPEPAQFPVDRVIPGWTEALKLMPVGSRWKLFIPSNLAYGEAGSLPRIQPNSTLVFDVELVDVQHSTPPQPLTSDIVKVPSQEEMNKGAKIEIIKAEDAAKHQSGQTNSPAK
jgi:FKBP-type peptidyl-prolyl cis-trans isomerase FklB